MAANVRYRATYYNTTGTSVTSVIEILDTEAVAQVINVETSGSPNESFEGLTQDLKPGIYPSSLRFGIYLRSSPKVRNGVTYGPSIGLLTDISTSAEGRFLARYKRDGVIHFVGPIIWDQSSYTDEDNPLLSITAVDGLNRWQTTDYISEVGQLVYYSKAVHIGAYDTSPQLYDGPIVSIPTMTVLDHSVSIRAGGAAWFVTTTWVHREVYSINSPGSGWVSQGQGLWAKSVDYTNEVITEDAPNTYKLTRDIDDEKHRTVSEYLERAIFETDMTGEYIAPAVMYDTNIEWREHSMGSGDPFTLTRLPETPFIGKTWNDVIQEICRLFFLRVYYSKGRYHFEQISTRDSSTQTRYTYQSDGTLIGTETASLDLNFDTLNIMPGVGGIYKFLAPFRSVEARIDLDTNNYLENVNWKDGVFGTKYVGRIKKADSVQKMLVFLNVAVTSTFDQATLALYPQSFINKICEHHTDLVYSVRLTRVSDGVTYWLEQDVVGSYAFVDGSWSATYQEIIGAVVNFGTPSRRFTVENFGHTIDKKAAILADTLPGAVDDMFDIHISFIPYVQFESPIGEAVWTTIHPDKFWWLANTSDNRMIFYSVATIGTLISSWTEADGNVELVYLSENDVDNSIKVKIELQWADTNQVDKRIEIYNGTDWQSSSEWSIGGIGTPVPIGELLVTEIMSLRTLPRKLYSGSYLSTLPNAETRFQRGTSFYLPLSCNKDTDVDTFQGEFLEIARTAAPEVETVESPIAGEPLPGLVGADPPEDFDSGLYFETNEAITATDVLTEVDIVNTLGIYVASGETVTIVNATTGESENVTLTQEILPADTVMYFESNVFTYSYPDGSVIVVQDGSVVIESGGSKYNYSNALYNGIEHTVPVAALDLAALTGLTGNQINKKIKVKRNGSEMLGWDPSTFAIVTPNPLFFSIDIAENQIIFATAFEFVDEVIVIDIDLNR